MKLEIERDLVQATVNYLKTKPFEEVHVLIQALLQCGPPKKKEPKKKDTQHGKNAK